MNINTLKAMDPLFYSPDGRSWNLQDSEVSITDCQKIISVPVRRYTHRSDTYTILACTDICSPMEIFYQLAVKRPEGVSFPATSDKDARNFKRLLEYAPITIGHYKKIEQKLLRKCANLRRRAFTEKMRAKYQETATECNMLTETTTREINEITVPLITPYQETVNHISVTARISVSAEDIRIIKALLQVAKHNANKEGTLLQHEGMFVTRYHGTKTLVRPVNFFFQVQIPGPLRIRQLLMSTNVLQFTGTIEDMLHMMDIDNVPDENPSTRNSAISVKDEKPMLTAKSTDPPTVEVNAKTHMRTLIADGDDYKDMKVVLDNDDKSMKIMHDDDYDDDCLGGLMGVYCRSSIHAEYSVVVTSAEKKIG